MPDPLINIFISYSHNDRAFVDCLEADLRNHGLSTWVDRRNLKGGQKWRRELQEAIDRCQVMLVVLSPDAVASEAVQTEYEYASDEQKLVIPLYYRACKIPMYLRRIQWIDFHESYEDGLASLLEALPWTANTVSSKPEPEQERSGTAFPSHRAPVTSEATMPLESPKRGVSRRTMVLGLAGLTIAGVTGGSLVWLTHSQGVHGSSPTSNPTSSSVPVQPINSSINSSGAMFGFDLQRSHFNRDEHILSPANVSYLVQHWAAPTGGLVNSSLAIAHGVVYVGSVDHNLYAFDASTGKILWTAATGNLIKSSPAVANGVVYIGSEDFKLHAFNALTGKPLWTAPTGGGIFSSPTVANGRVYIGSEDFKLYAFDASTGKILWTATTGGSIFSSPTVIDGAVYVGSVDHKLYAFNALTGKILWTATTGVGIRSSPTVVDGVVYVGSIDSNLYAFNSETGQPLWTAPTGGGIFSSPAVANGVVYVGSMDFKLYALDASTGKVLWTVTTGDRIFSSPAIANGVIYVGSDDHKLYALDASTGKILWTVTTGGGIFSSPLVFNGVVYVGSDDFKLYAFSLPNSTK